MTFSICWAISKKRRMPDGGMCVMTVLRGLRGAEAAVVETKGCLSTSGPLHSVLLCFGSNIVIKGPSTVAGAFAGGERLRLIILTSWQPVANRTTGNILI